MATPKIFESAWIYFAGAILLILAAIASQIDVHIPRERPEGSAEDLLTLGERDDMNLLFIVIDTLRADRMEAYGSSRTTSPIMSELASTGIRFEHVESQSSWTKASMASMWQAMYPERTGIQRYFQSLTDDAQMPAEILSEAGFRTGGIWRNGWVAANFGFNQGFDLYMRPNSTRRVGMMIGNPSAKKLAGTDYDATEAAFGFLESYMNERWFLYVHYMDVHQSLYADTSPIYGTTVSDFYDSSIHWVDRNVGMLVNALRDRNLLDKTMIVIMSDHGEGFFEHGQEGHARTLFREVQQVPLLIIPPFEIPGGIVVEPNVANVDIWPTVLDLLDLPPLERADGRSLVPLIEAAASDAPPSQQARALAERGLFSQLDLSWGKVEVESDPLVAMLKGDHRAIARTKHAGRAWLYDHAVDPLERKNIAAEEPEIYAALRAEIQAFLDAESQHEVETEDIELSEMRLHQLRALGYVIEPRTKNKPGAAAPQE
ncbi:MAG: sulfatase [bacterium]|nr:sulfatase [bacterium]